jgi:hypothetical protein
MRELFLEKNFKEDIHVRDILHFTCELCGQKVTRKGMHFNGKLLCKNCNMRSSMLEKYGVENFSQSDIAKSKIKAVSQETIEKRKRTCLEKYGVENPFQSPEIIEKSKQKIIEKYGYYGGQLHTKNAQEKRKRTCLEKYGVENPLQSKKIQNKISPNRHKFTADNNPMNSETIKDKIVKCRKPKYIYDNERFDSSTELYFFIYQKENGADIKRANICLDYVFDKKIHHYYPDFMVNDKLIEIKGSQFLKKDGTWKNPYNSKGDKLLEAKHQCAINSGVKILYSEDCKIFETWVKEKYSSNYIKQFRIYE